MYVKEFNLTAPADTHKAFTIPGTFHVGAHEWFVFLKPLPPGDNPEGEWDLHVAGTTANLVGTSFVSLNSGMTADVLCLPLWIPSIRNSK